MPFRVSVLDLTAAVVVLVAIFLPDRGLNAVRAYETDRDTNHEIALQQAILAERPTDGEAAARLSELLIQVKQSDWAIQVAANAADEKRGDAWRALLATSLAHAERVEVAQAHEFAERALAECRRAGSTACPPHQETRLSVYFSQLDAGAKSGIDPRIDPSGYYQAVSNKTIMVRPLGATPRDIPDSDTKNDGTDKTDDGADKTDDGAGKTDDGAGKTDDGAGKTDDGQGKGASEAPDEGASKDGESAEPAN